MQQLVVRFARVLQDEGVEAQPRVVDGGEHDSDGVEEAEHVTPEELQRAWLGLGLGLGLGL